MPELLVRMIEWTVTTSSVPANGVVSRRRLSNTTRGLPYVTHLAGSMPRSGNNGAGGRAGGMTNATRWERQVTSPCRVFVSGCSADGGRGSSAVFKASPAPKPTTRPSVRSFTRRCRRCIRVPRRVATGARAGRRRPHRRRAGGRPGYRLHRLPHHRCTRSPPPHPHRPRRHRPPSHPPARRTLPPSLHRHRRRLGGPMHRPSGSHDPGERTCSQCKMSARAAGSRPPRPQQPAQQVWRCDN